MKSSYKSSYRKIASLLNCNEPSFDKHISSLVWSSGEACENSCYIAIKGEKYDGNDYIDKAIKNGAELIISDENIKCSKPVIRVENSRLALCILAKENVKNTTVIGITGSVGKTTVKEMVKSVLSQKYSVSGTMDNENNEIGVAKTLLSVKNEDFCIVEMGMRARGEISFLSKVCAPEASIITNCGSAHIGKLGSHNEIFNGKLEILEHTKKYCILPYESRFIKAYKYKLFPIYIGQNGNYEAKNLSFGDKSIFSVMENGKNCGEISLSTISKYNTENSLFAYALGRIYFLEHNEIKRGLEKFKNIGFREQIDIINGITVILDCYNASYEGVRASIDSFKGFCERRGLIPVVVLGCMRETGEYSTEYHFRIGEYLKDLGIKNLIGYKIDAAGYLDGFLGGVLLCDKSNTSEYILSNFNEKHAILFKGSRSERLEEIIIEMKEQLK